MGLYELSLLAFFLVLPLGATAAEWLFFAAGPLGLAAVGRIAWRWFVFFGVGLGLGSAGLKQVLDPEFTAHQLFDARGSGTRPLVRELGFANLCLGALGILSLWRPDFRLPATVAGGGYFLLAGLGHLGRPEKSGRGRLAMGGDFFMALVLAGTTLLALLG